MPVIDHSTPAAVMRRLAEIEGDLAVRQNQYEQAAGMRARLVRDWEKRIAECRIGAEGSDADARKAVALDAAIAQDDLYTQLQEAEAWFESCRAVVKVLEVRATIGTSILKAQGRG